MLNGHNLKLKYTMKIKNLALLTIPPDDEILDDICLFRITFEHERPSLQLFMRKFRTFEEILSFN